LKLLVFGSSTTSTTNASRTSYQAWSQGLDSGIYYK